MSAHLSARGIGDGDGPRTRTRIEGVNLLTAATSWRSPFQRLGFWLLRRTDWQARFLAGAQSLSLNLTDLNHLHYGSWVDVGTFPDVLATPEPPLESGRRYWNIFNGNFNHGWEPYMESFLDNTAGGVHLAWGDTVGYSGYPRHGSLKETLRWQSARRIDNLHYYTAYPYATTNDVRAAVRLRRELLSFEATARALDLPAAARKAERGRLIARLQHCRTGLPEHATVADVEFGPADARGMDGVTALFPVLPDRVGQVVAAARCLPTDDSSPFARLPGTHLGRIAVIPEGTTAGDGDSVPIRNTWLMFAAVFDVCHPVPSDRRRMHIDDIGRYAQAIDDRETLSDVFAACHGFGQRPFVEWFTSGVCNRYLVYRNYPDVTLRDIRNGLEQAHELERELQKDDRERRQSADEEPEAAHGGEEEVLPASHGDEGSL